MSFGETLTKLAIGAAIGGTAVYLWDRYLSDDLDDEDYIAPLDDDDVTASDNKFQEEPQSQSEEIRADDETASNAQTDSSSGFISQVVKNISDLDKNQNTSSNTKEEDAGTAIYSAFKAEPNA